MATTTLLTMTSPSPSPSPTPAPTTHPFDFDPRNQTFFIAGRDGRATIPISMPAIEAQRVRLASLAVNYGCQLGLALMSLLVVLLLLPPRRLRRPVHLAQLAALAAAAARLALLVLYFPGPLAGYYVAWTRDAAGARVAPSDYAANTAAGALGVAQLALVEAALVLQARAMIRTWPRAWQLPPLLFSGLLAAAAVCVRGVWEAQRERALLAGATLPVPLTRAGEAAVALGAAAIFWFCGVFFAHLTLHLACTRGALGGRRTRAGTGARGRLRAFRLSSLEILAIGNGVLMLAPRWNEQGLFAGLDIAAGIGDNKILPFDAGSWVLTITTAGLPLIGLVAHYRGASTRSEPGAAVSLFFAADKDAGVDADAPTLGPYGRGGGGGGGIYSRRFGGGGGGGDGGGDGGRGEGRDNDDINDNNNNNKAMVLQLEKEASDGSNTISKPRQQPLGDDARTTTKFDIIAWKKAPDMEAERGVEEAETASHERGRGHDNAEELGHSRGGSRSSSGGIHVRTDYSVTVGEAESGTREGGTCYKRGEFS